MVRLFVYCFFAMCASTAIISSKVLEYESFVKPDFLFGFLGLFIGFALTLYTYITSTFDAIKNKIQSKYASNKKELDKRLAILPRVHQEISDDIQFLIACLFLVCGVFLFRGLCPVTIRIILDVPLLGVFILALIALKDLVGATFRISQFLVE